MKVLHTCSDHLQHTPGYLLELRTKVREDFTITVKALVGAFSVIMSLRFMLSQCSVPSHFVMENIAIYLLPPAAPSWSPSASPASAPWPGPAVWRSKVTVWCDLSFLSIILVPAPSLTACCHLLLPLLPSSRLPPDTLAIRA